MQQKSTISVDVNNKEYYKKIVPQPQVLTSHEAGWKDIVLEYHRQPAHELPETTNFQQHILAVYLKELAAEFKMNSRYEVRNVHSGDLVIIPANMDYWNADRTDSEFVVLSVEPQKLLHSSQDLIKGDLIELIPTISQPDPFIYGTALALKQELETDYQGCRLYAETLSNSLAVHLLRKYAAAKLQRRSSYRKLSPSKLKQILDLIGDRLSEEISISEIAEYINMSQFYFVRQFKRSVGVTPYRYIMHQRVEMAKRLLKQDLPLAEVALACGFANQSHLGRVFKQFTGTTPRRYRQAL